MRIPSSPTQIHIDQKALAHNIRVLRKSAQKNHKVFTILAVVKANAYGHGVKQVVEILEKEGVNFFAVSDVAEGVEIRGFTRKPVLLFESTLPEDISAIVKNNLTPTISNFAFAQKLNLYAQKARKNVKVHVEIDTGMNRLGIPINEANAFFRKIVRLKHVHVEGVFTHFPSADTDKTFTQKQIKQFSQLIKNLERIGVSVPLIHTSNSAATFLSKSQACNVIRPGLSIYGLYPIDKLPNGLKLRSVMSVQSKVILLKSVSKGEGVSYGRTFRVKKNMRIAVIPIGYSDGYLRALSNKADVLINGMRCGVLGRVTMDQIMVDVTRIKNVRIGSPVVILGKQKNQTITAEELARHAQTINYEITCALGNALIK